MTSDLTRWRAIVEANTLRQLRVADIDLDSAAQHFDLPIHDQFAKPSDIRRSLNDTKKSLLALFAGQSEITIYRALEEELAGLVSHQLGIAWAWGLDGAMKATRLRDGIVVTGSVKADDVDWAMTVAVSTFHEDEQEIVLHSGSPVRIMAVHEVRGGKIGDDVTPASLRGMMSNA